MKIFALIPARGGSKSIKKKNIAPFLGKPLMEHVLECASRCSKIDRIICSTDDEEIADVARKMGAEIHQRSEELSSDNSPVLDTVNAVIDMVEAGEEDLIVLLQPTSPFTLPEHVEDLIDVIVADKESTGGETIANFPHNYHAYNQREISGGQVKFHFMEERLRCHNKQAKPKFYKFGNVIISKVASIRKNGNLWGDHCKYHLIDQPYSTDVDGPDDWPYGQWLFESGQVKLPWLEKKD